MDDLTAQWSVFAALHHRQQYPKSFIFLLVPSMADHVLMMQRNVPFLWVDSQLFEVVTVVRCSWIDQNQESNLENPADAAHT
jgi:hypothetical protein